ncbi:MAG: hypothetical protein H6754_02295 [Candidatus Omnitrophica bacterium]|nr:hypothetical protein [Candidatus Omnitrophota bacterium]
MLRRIVEKYLKSAWLSVILLILLPSLSLFLVMLISPSSQVLYYTDREVYYLWEKAPGYVDKIVFIVAAVGVGISVIYKIKNKLWQPLQNLLIILLCFLTIWYVREVFKRTVAGRVATVEDQDRYIRGDLRSISNRLEFFRKKNGFYPSVLKEAVSESEFKDSRGYPFRYEVKNDGQSFELKSAGIDGKFGSVDDIDLKDAGK